MPRNWVQWASTGLTLWSLGCSVDVRGTRQALLVNEPAPVDTGDVTERDAGPQAASEHDAAVEAPGEPAPPMPEPIRLHHLQLRGSHRSYHVAPAVTFDNARNYTHAEIKDQLEKQDVRALELTLHKNGEELEVYDTAVLDPGTRCQKLAQCLGDLRTWSDAHPLHVPVIVWLDASQDNAIDDESLIDPLILRSFPRARLITPSSLKGDHASVREAIEEQGFPRLDEVRGKVMFVLNGTDALHKTYVSEADVHPLFVSAAEREYAEPWALVTRIDDPMQAAALRAAVDARLLIVSTTCTAALPDAACIARRDAALSGGAHVLLDDFPAPVNTRSYWLDMTQGAAARCNPVTSGEGCRGELLREAEQAQSAR